jgi:hypothetical protein
MLVKKLAIVDVETLKVKEWVSDLTGAEVEEYLQDPQYKMITITKIIKTVKHIHCPVNGWDCPYYTDKNHPCRCTLADPYKDCDDFASMWDEDDDWEDDDWIV